MGDDMDALFELGDDDPLWQRVELMANAPPRPAKGYVTCSMAFLTRIRPLVRSTDQLLVLLLLYRCCLLSRSQTVELPNGEIAKLGISRQTKYRLLAWLQEMGAGTVEEVPHGRSVRVTLHWFP
jgi:hypothetical protein